jgi:hypothetical protein
MAKPTATLDSIQTAILLADEQATELLKGVSGSQANWQPNEGHNWSICQCLDHLTKVNSVYAAALQEAVKNCPRGYKQPTPDIVPGFFGAWFIQQMDLPVRMRLKAPSKAVPALKRNAGELLDAFLKSHELIRRVVEGAKAVDVNRLRFKKSFYWRHSFHRWNRPDDYQRA